MSRRTLRTIIVIVLVVALGLGSIFALRACFTEKDAEAKKQISIGYDIGALSKDGKYVEAETSLYTKDAFACEGLRITPIFDNTITYRVFFYDQDGYFISATDTLDNIYTNVPLVACYARIEITPDDDDVVSWWEKASYANQLKVEVFEKQEGLGDNKLVFSKESQSESSGVISFTSDTVSLAGYKYLVFAIRSYGNGSCCVKDSSGNLLVNVNFKLPAGGALAETVTPIENVTQPIYTKVQAGNNYYFIWDISETMSKAYVWLTLDSRDTMSLYLL